MKAIRKLIVVCVLAMAVLPGTSFAAQQTLTGNVTFLYYWTSGSTQVGLMTVSDGTTSLSCGISENGTDDGRITLLSNAKSANRTVTITCDGMLAGVTIY